MKRFLTADIHLGKNTVDEEELFSVLYYMLESAVEHKCTHFDILGDLLENRSLLLFRIWPRVKQYFNDLVDTGMTVSLMAGNHDFYGTTKRAESNLRHVALNDRVRIIDTIHLEEDILWVPWLFPGEEIPAGGKVVLAHLAINGFNLSQHRVEDDGVEVPVRDTPVYTGHFHSAQSTGNIRYLGSPIHHNWNDANETKLAYVLDEKFEVSDTVELNAKFTNLIKINFEDIRDLSLHGKSKVTVVDTPKGDEELIIKALLELGATSVECLAKEQNLEIDTIDAGTSRGLSVEEAVEEQIEEHDMKDELSAFHQILNAD